MAYLIFDQPGKYEWGYEPFRLTEENIKKNAGKSIVYLTRANIDPTRGYAFPRYTTIGRKRYTSLISADGTDSIDIRDIVECGIKKTEPIK